MNTNKLLKVLKIFIILLFVLILQSCNNKETIIDEPPVQKPYFSFVMDNEQWIADSIGYTAINEKYIYIEAYRKKDGSSISIHLNTWVDYEFGFSKYINNNIITSSNGVLNISQYDTNLQQVSGTFSAVIYDGNFLSSKKVEGQFKNIKILDINIKMFCPVEYKLSEQDVTSFQGEWFFIGFEKDGKILPPPYIGHFYIKFNTIINSSPLKYSFHINSINHSVYGSCVPNLNKLIFNFDTEVVTLAAYPDWAHSFEIKFESAIRNLSGTYSISKNILTLPMRYEYGENMLFYLKQ